MAQVGLEVQLLHWKVVHLHINYTYIFYYTQKNNTTELVQWIKTGIMVL